MKHSSVYNALALIGVIAIAAACSKAPAVKPAERIYHGGPIVTVDDAKPSAEAVAVREGKIVAVDTKAEVMKLQGSGTELVDLGGKTLAPGFVDGHAHFAQFGAQAVGANLLAPPDGGVNTIDDLVLVRPRNIASRPRLTLAMLTPQHALVTDSHGAPAARTRGALALGLVGALGEELLALLVSGVDYAFVHVAVTSGVGLMASRFRPWKVGDGVVLADDAFVAVTGDETFVPTGSPIARYGEAQLLEAARIARGCGVTRLTVIAPLAALRNDGAATRTLDPQIEIALRQMGFERLLIVWPTATDATRGTGVRGMLRALGRALPDRMLPADARAITARSAALAIAEAARAAAPRVAVLGVRELLQTTQPLR